MKVKIQYGQRHVGEALVTAKELALAGFVVEGQVHDEPALGYTLCAERGVTVVTQEDIKKAWDLAYNTRENTGGNIDEHVLFYFVQMLRSKGVNVP